MDRTSDRGFELGKNKRVTIRRFKNLNLIDIREYYLDQSSGEMKPGKKGISLTEEQYDQLIRHRSEIENALIDLGSSRSLTEKTDIGSLLEKKPKKAKVKEEKPKTKNSDSKNDAVVEEAGKANEIANAPSSFSNPRLDDHLEKIKRVEPEDDDDDNTMEKDLVNVLSQGHNLSDEDISEAD